MIRTICLFVASAWISVHAFAATIAVQSPSRAQPGAQARPAPGQVGPLADPAQGKPAVDPEFDALWKQYVSAVRDWEAARWEAGRKNQPDNFPHPAPKFVARFTQLADKDNGDAQCWVIENLELAYPTDEAAQARTLREMLPRVIAKHADIDAVARAVQGIKAQVEAVGEKQAVEML